MIINVKTDCISYQSDDYYRGCKWLKEQVCQHKKCSFYKKRKKEAK